MGADHLRFDLCLQVKASSMIFIIQICQYDMMYDDSYSLGTYTKWTITEFDPLEFQIVYDGGTSDGTYERCIFKILFPSLGISCLVCH